MHRNGGMCLSLSALAFFLPKSKERCVEQGERILNIFLRNKIRGAHTPGTCKQDARLPLCCATVTSPARATGGNSNGPWGNGNTVPAEQETVAAAREDLSPPPFTAESTRAPPAEEGGATRYLRSDTLERTRNISQQAKTSNKQQRPSSTLGGCAGVQLNGVS